MRRTFAEHKVRTVTSLDGLWTLRPQDGSEKVYSAMVPGVWERIPALTSFRGTAEYERTVNIEKQGHYLLRMGAVSHNGHVYWDGQLVGKHYNAFTGFDVLLENVSAGTHQLRVNVDNRFTEESTLHIPNDYYTYGGINRSVELHQVGGAYIDRVSFYSKKIAEGTYTAHVKVYVRAVENVKEARVQLKLAGAEAEICLADLTVGQTCEAEAAFDVQDITEWDVLKPHLYELKAALLIGDAAEDDLIERVGFRMVEIEGEKILLNGKPLQIRGFNRHEDHGLYGCALPQEAMMDDLQRVLDMGANAIRTCHYPNDPKFLDLCDELGILVWEEHHARALPIEILKKPLFAEQEGCCNEEMIAQHVNHPCIYIWGVLNECESETEVGREVYAAQLNHLRRLDPTRPVSYASCRSFSDICQDLVDVVSWNVYPKWYHDESVAQYAQRLTEWVDAHGGKGKPMLITEVGAGAIAGYHDPLGRAKWSEERQCDILEEQLTTLLNHPRLSGVYIWQFADVRVAEEWSMHRPKTQNNKGVVDMFRQPKMSYFTVKKIFGSK